MISLRVFLILNERELVSTQPFSGVFNHSFLYLYCIMFYCSVIFIDRSTRIIIIQPIIELYLLSRQQYSLRVVYY